MPQDLNQAQEYAEKWLGIIEKPERPGEEKAKWIIEESRKTLGSISIKAGLIIANQSPRLASGPPLNGQDAAQPLKTCWVENILIFWAALA